MPVVAMLTAVVAPALPTFITIESVAPTPVVDCKVSDEPVPVPPYTDAAVKDVTLGVAEYAGAVPVPADTKTDPVATAANLDSAVVVDAYNKSPTV
jgi:hypothetical protein